MLRFQILHCIGALYKLVVTVNLLQETGIGRTVNGMCKSEAGEVRAAAKGLVNKWKALVVNESEDEPARQSQEEELEGEETASPRKHHSSSNGGTHRKDSDRIKKEREHRSHHSHNKSSSGSSSSRKEGSESKQHRDRAERIEGASPSATTTTNTNGGSSSMAMMSGKATSDRHHHHPKESSSSSTSASHQSSKKKTSSDRHREDKGAARKRSRERDHKDRSSSKRHRTERQTQEATVELDEEQSEDVEIDGSAGTSFADALAMMDGPGSTPVKVSKSSTTSSSGGNRQAALSSAGGEAAAAVKTKGASLAGSSRSLSHATASKAVAGGSRSSGSSRPTDSGSGPPKLLAPSIKLAPLLDPEQLKRDILGPSVVISNSYTPASYLNPVNLVGVSAAIQKNKRPGVGQPNAPHAAVVDPNNFEILQSKARTKVYSGNKCAAMVLSLHEMCIRVLQKNVDALEYTGGVPYDILEPILLKCSANQLDQIEYYNPYLGEDTNELWKKHALRQFRGKKRQEMESWREMYQVSALEDGGSACAY